MGVAAVPVALALASAGASAYNTNRTAKKQDQAAAAGIRKQAENQKEVNQRLNKTLEFAQQSTPDEARTTANQKYLATLQAKRAQANAGLAPQGISSAFDADAQAAAASSQAGAEQAAGLLSRIDAGTAQRASEGMAYGNLGMDLDRVRGNISGDEFLNRLRVGAIRRNPWIDAGAAALSGVGAGYGASAGGGAGYDTYSTMTNSRGDLPQTLTFRRPRTGRGGG
jgi:hypothetical protein